MLQTFLKKIFGTKNDRDLKMLQPIVDQINSFEPTIKALSDEELKAQTNKLKKLLSEGKTLNDILPEAFATVREASVRTLGQRHFDVQMMGGVVLHQGKIAEMKTGEGKTLCATLPLYLNALSGAGAHLVTVNDYLAKRDSEWMGVIYNFLGLTVGVIVSDMSDEDRQKAYNSDITYGTNNEFAFDYLRDNMKFDLAHYVQKPHNFCIVDEVDSILVDEARTPLLISGPSEGNSDLYKVANKIIPQLVKKEHYTLDEKTKTAVLTEPGIIKIQELLKIKNLFEVQNVPLLHHLNQSLRAWTLFTPDVDYVVKDGRVIIVDEFTGRLKEGSRWSDGLHQAIEAKEGVEIRSENQTLASITFQNYFRLYEKLAGMTGTADTEAEEFKKIYNLEVVVIPTNIKMIRNDLPDVIYKDKNCKFNAVVDLIQDCYKRGQPVLVGTISIENSELISERLKKANIPHEVLNAKHHEREANIIINAGFKSAVTIATNMAGRGTDIKLIEDSRAAGGLYILGTERHESRRIDNQLRGRSGRQGDPGTSKFFLSLEDDLMRIFGSERIKSIMNTLGMKEDEPIEHKMISNAIAKAQKKVESHNFDIRKHLLDYDNVMNEQRKIIYTLRKDILNKKMNMELIEEMVDDVVILFSTHFKPSGRSSSENWNWEEMVQGYKNVFHTDYTVNNADCIKDHEGDVEAYLIAIAKKLLKEKFAKYDPEQVKNALREILLSILDHYWKDHLLNMDHLKEGIGLKAYAQQDPLNAYKRESFQLFTQMKIAVKQAVINNVFGVELYTQEEIDELKRKQEAYLEAQMEAHRRAQKAKELEALREIQRKSAHTQGTAAASVASGIAGAVLAGAGNAEGAHAAAEKIGRNAPCPCGSGKKFKHCHGS
ncbi:MAG: preprotein translocase subunit SecA [Oligoflexia bacterium]|nr:preprotein translocase subunit SecA [Oligoflexia bacterium]